MASCKKEVFTEFIGLDSSMPAVAKETLSAETSAHPPPQVPLS
jgi:hypothetical protein